MRIKYTDATGVMYVTEIAQAYIADLANDKSIVLDDNFDNGDCTELPKQKALVCLPALAPSINEELLVFIDDQATLYNKLNELAITGTVSAMNYTVLYCKYKDDDDEPKHLTAFD